MARSTIEHDQQMVVAVGFGELFEETLQASTVHPGKIETEALSRCRFDRRIEVGPLVGAPDDVGRTKPLRTVASPVPVDQAETCFIKGQDLQGLVWLSATDLPYLIGKVFLKASCSCGSAFSWRGLPVLSFTFRRLKSCPTPSG
jgi:hypothetical protein